MSRPADRIIPGQVYCKNSLVGFDRAGLLKDKKIEKLIEYLQSIRDTNFTGYIKINFTQGQIGRIEKFEEILKS